MKLLTDSSGKMAHWFLWKKWQLISIIENQYRRAPTRFYIEAVFHEIYYAGKTTAFTANQQGTELKLDPYVNR